MKCLKLIEKVFGRELTPSEIAAAHLAAAASLNEVLGQEQRNQHDNAKAAR